MERKKKFSFIFMLFVSSWLIHLIDSANVRLKSNEKNNNYLILIDNETIHLKNLNMISISLDEYCKSKIECFKTSSEVHSIDFSSNNLQKIPNDLINKWFCSSLKTFNLAHNSIENLTLNFTSTSNVLESIDFSFNRLNSIEADTFRNFNSLKYLNLANNKLSNINLFAFEKTRSLIDLNLSNNLISENSMEFLLFASLTNLKYLRMDNNRLASLSHHLLFNLYSLEHLSLKGNNLLSFELLKLSKNNLFLKYIDLSFNKHLKFEIESTKPTNNNNNEEQTNLIDFKINNFQLETLILAGVDLSGTSDQFLDVLFDKFRQIKHFNLSYTNIKAVWSLKWPRTIETIDLSFNLIRDDQFDCRQWSFEQLTNQELDIRFIYLNNNQLSNFKKIIENCAPILSKLSSLKIDLRFNLFNRLDLVQSSPPNHLPRQQMSIMKCSKSLNKSSLLLYGNPLICDCETNSWWSNIASTNLFYVNNQFCFNIDDYDSLNCHSSQLKDSMRFDQIRNDLIASRLICSYSHSCSPKTCKCCGFKACDCSFNCPAGCKCSRDFAYTYDIVNCTHVSMNTMPMYLPATTTDLLFEQNNLKKIQPFQFFGRFRLTKIDLSSNKIGFIEENSFNGLVKLKSLNLSYNNLQILLGYEFRDLNQLESLDLESNQIQFISNLTFTYLIKLKYLSLKYNQLKHSIDYKIFFQFNHQLINFSFDMASAGGGTYETVDSNSTLDKQSSEFSTDYYYSDYYEDSSARNNIKNKIENNSEKLIENLLSSQKFKISDLARRMLTDCIMDKYKQLINSNNDKEEIVLIKNFKRFKTDCLKNANLNEETSDSNSIEKVKLFKKESSFIKQNSALLQQHQVTKPITISQSFIILNYNTIIMGSVLFFLILILFSIMLTVLIIKLQRSKQKNHNNLLLKETSQSDEYYNCQTWQILRSLLKIIRNKMNGLFFQKSQKSKSKDISSSKVIHYEQSIKNTRVYVHHPHSINNNEDDYDIFIVYNKLDSDLVHNVIAPILRSKPYNFSVVLQHSINNNKCKSSTMNSSNLNSNNTSEESLHSSFYSLSCDSSSSNDFINDSFIKASTLVLFVLSKHLFTEFEYNLSVKTPKNKKLAILADDLSVEICENILKPKKILRGQFDLDKMTFNFHCAKKCDEYDLMDEIRSSRMTSENNSLASSVFLHRSRADESFSAKHVKV